MKYRCRALMPLKEGSFLYAVDAVQCEASACAFEGRTIDEGGNIIPTCSAHRLIYFAGGTLRYVDTGGEIMETHANDRG